jgi:cysteine sulfinate desulfinase/cysteine desulfurase-like protein
MKKGTRCYRLDKQIVQKIKRTGRQEQEIPDVTETLHRAKAMAAPLRTARASLHRKTNIFSDIANTSNEARRQG